MCVPFQPCYPPPPLFQVWFQNRRTKWRKRHAAEMATAKRRQENVEGGGGGSDICDEGDSENEEEEEEEEREEEVVEEEEVEERDESRWTILPTSLFQTGSMILSRRHLIWVSWHSWSSCTQPERELYRQNIRPFVIFGHL